MKLPSGSIILPVMAMTAAWLHIRNANRAKTPTPKPVVWFSAIVTVLLVALIITKIFVDT